jgi:hypothetical protein
LFIEREAHGVSVSVFERGAGPNLWDHLMHVVSGFDVFVSYSRRDSQYAFPLAQKLVQAGFDAFLDQLAALPGREVPREVQRALYRSRLLVVVVSPHSLGSTNVAREVRAFLKTKGEILLVGPGEARTPPEWGEGLRTRTVVEDVSMRESGTPTAGVLDEIASAVASPRAATRVRALFGVAAVLCAVALWGASRSLAAGQKARAGATAARQTRDQASEQAARARNDEKAAQAAASDAEKKRQHAELDEGKKRELTERTRQSMLRLGEALTLHSDVATTIASDGVFRFVADRTSGMHHKLTPVGGRSDEIELMVFAAEGFTLPVDRPPFVFEYTSDRPFRNSSAILLLRDGLVVVEHLDVLALEHEAARAPPPTSR